jgi:hypothetical protein
MRNALMLVRDLSYVLAFGIGIGLAFVAVLCSRSVVGHTAQWNGDGGAFVFFAWAGSFICIMAWIGITRPGDKPRDDE